MIRRESFPKKRKRQLFVKNAREPRDPQHTRGRALPHHLGTRLVAARGAAVDLGLLRDDDDFFDAGVGRSLRKTAFTLDKRERARESE